MKMSLKETVLLLALMFLVQSCSSVGDGVTDDRIHVIFSGDHADPTIVRDGEDFYLTYSSYSKQPGLKIWHSRNLVDWTPISYALTENPGSVWAPDIIKHDDFFTSIFRLKGKAMLPLRKIQRVHGASRYCWTSRDHGSIPGIWAAVVMWMMRL